MIAIVAVRFSVSIVTRAVQPVIYNDHRLESPCHIAASKLQPDDPAARLDFADHFALRPPHHFRAVLFRDDDVMPMPMLKT